MRKEYGKVLRKSFPDRLAERLPQFEPYEEKSDFYAPSERCFRWQARGDLSAFVICSPDERGHEGFFVEIGWSVHNRLPRLSRRPSFQPSAERREFLEAEAMTRLPYLVGAEEMYRIEPALEAFSIEHLLAQQRKLTPDEAAAKVAPVIDRAIEHLVQAGLPYLQELAAATRD